MKTIAFPILSVRKYGGDKYIGCAQQALKADFNVETIDIRAKYFGERRYLKFIELFYNLFKLKGKKDIWIRDFYSAVTLDKKRTAGKNIVIIFHIDFLKFPLLSRIPLYLAEKIFLYRKLRQADAIVVASDYWKNYFLEKGYENIYKIYCGFNISDFNFTEEEITDFRKKHKIDGKPVIYLGNCQRWKGAADAYNELKDINAHFVTSGRRQIKIGAMNLDLNYKDYLRLLKCSSVALTMSQFKEGWCMTTHEAMLCKTPVIGSGQGGMRELLEGGGQIICEDFKRLKEKVEFLLKNPDKRKTLGESGFSFAKDFTMERFEKAWVEAVKKTLNHE